MDYEHHFSQLKNKETQLNIFHDTIANGFSVREVEQIVKEFDESIYSRTSKKKTIIASTIPFSYQQEIYELSKTLNFEVELKRNKKGNGKIIIPFNSDEDLAKLIEKINN